MNIINILAQELIAQKKQIEAAIDLLDAGSTVPFIARYRKEVTGGLTDTQLRNLEERLLYLRELNERKNVIVASLQSQGKITDELKNKIEAASSKSYLEDLYLPFKPKRHTKAQMAKEAGLDSLAQSLLSNPVQEPVALAKQYVNTEKKLTMSKWL